MIKKILILIFVLLSLSSCSNPLSSVTSSTWSWLVSYSWDNFSIDIPWNWQNIENTDESLPKPWNWKIELSLTSKDVKNWFSNNLLVLSSDLKAKISSKDFSIWNYVWAKKEYVNYNLIETKDFTFNDNELSFLHTFEWRYNEQTPKIRFLQVWHVCNEVKVFFVTIALSPEITDSSKYENILKTFSCK